MPHEIANTPVKERPFPWRPCEHCGAMFEAKRRNVRFCGKSCVNSAYREAKREEISAYWKAYREANRDKLLSYQKAYFEANCDKELARRKAYREANREEISVSQKAYREANREKLLASLRHRRSKRLIELAALDLLTLQNDIAKQSE